MAESDTSFAVLFFSLITCQPLYVFYFIFFSPYLLKLLSYLSPVLLTTLLLSFSFLTLIDRLRPGNEGVNGRSDDLAIHDIVFGKVDEDDEEQQVDNTREEKDRDVVVCKTETKPLVNSCQELRLENFLQILDQFEKRSSVSKTVPVQPLGRGLKSTSPLQKKLDQFERMSSACTGVEKKTKNEPKGDKVVVERHRIVTEESIVKDGSDANGVSTRDQQSSKNTKLSRSQSVSFSSIGTYGSMRKEKEWTRTLACKLYEERHNDGGGEGMDLLWERYEDDVKTKGRNKKKSDEAHEDEEEDIMTGQLCCLQALKMSTAKMNFGMRKPSLLKFSKAVKGIGWLHSLSKHSKKVHNNSQAS